MKKNTSIEEKRYQIILPFLKKAKKLKEIEAETNISYATLKRWVSMYKQNGIDGLEKKEREDKNSFRNFTEAELKEIEKFCQKNSETSIKKLYSLWKSKMKKDLNISYVTFYRIVNNIESFFNKDTVRYLQNIKIKNSCYIVLDIPLYILVKSKDLDKKIVPRLLIILDSATLEPLNFDIEANYSNLYSLLGFIREGILKVSLKANNLVYPKEILVASKHINNKKILKEIHQKLGIKILEHYTENSEIQKFIKYIQSDISSFYTEKNRELSMIELKEFLSNYIFFQKKEFAFSINYPLIEHKVFVRKLDVFLQEVNRKLYNSKVRVKNKNYDIRILKSKVSEVVKIRFSPLNKGIVYIYEGNEYVGYGIVYN